MSYTERHFHVKVIRLPTSTSCHPLYPHHPKNPLQSFVYRFGQYFFSRTNNSYQIPFDRQILRVFLAFYQMIPKLQLVSLLKIIVAS